MLPVCVYCVPPWINGKEEWWYEVKNSRGTQDRPKPRQLQDALEMRNKHEPRCDIDKDLSEKYADRNYREKFNIDQLLNHWDESSQKYDFKDTPVWNEEKQYYEYL
jgi:hypothetical protein